MYLAITTKKCGNFYSEKIERKRENGMKNLFIVKRVVEDKELSDEAFTVWCGLRNIMQLNVMEYFVSFNMIAYSVFNRQPNRYELEAIKRGYCELVEAEYIKVIAEYSKTEYVVDLSALYFVSGQEFFVDLSMEEMQKIMSLDCGRHSKYKLLRYFTCMLGTFNKSKGKEYYRIGGMSLDGFTELIPITKPTCIAFNDILEENEILFVIRHKDFYAYNVGSGQEIREIPNTYSRWKDMKYAKKYAESVNGYKYFEQQKGEKTSQANKKRSLGRKLNFFINYSKEYDIETIKELYDYACDRNKRMEEGYLRDKENGLNPAEPQYCDMSSFNDYLLYFKGEGEVNE